MIDSGVSKIDGRNGMWYQTFTGKQFWAMDPKPEDIDIRDIAHALSMQCRFTGHIRDFYSVGEHSIRVSFAGAPQDALWGLLHDAAEAYLVDLARPVKHDPRMLPYRQAEVRLMAAICDKFGLPLEQPESVHTADQVLLSTEARDLMAPPLLPGWDKWLDRPSLPYPLRPLSHHMAEQAFLLRFETLLKGAAEGMNVAWRSILGVPLGVEERAVA